MNKTYLATQRLLFMMSCRDYVFLRDLAFYDDVVSVRFVETSRNRRYKVKVAITAPRGHEALQDIKGYLLRKRGELAGVRSKRIPLSLPTGQ